MFLNRCFVALVCLLTAASTGLAQTTWHVDDDNCPGPGDGSFGNPFCLIQDAIDAAVNGDSVEVAPGTYMESIDLLGKAIEVYSTDGATATTIDGTGQFHVVVIAGGEGPDTVLDGFTITGGNANGAAPDHRGGGVFAPNSTPLIAGCIVVANHADDRGGGVYTTGATLRECLIAGNSTGSRGGGVGTAGAASIINCAFSGNSAGFQGGALWASGDPIVINCSFANNDCPSGGAILSQSGTLTVHNSVFRGNTTNTLQVLGTAVVTYSNVEGGYAGTGNIDADPLLVDPDGADDIVGTADDDLRIQEFSPCIDAADNTVVPIDVTIDLDGEPRFYDDTNVPDTGNGTAPIVDMGSCERQMTSGAGLIVLAPGQPIQDAITAATNGDVIVLMPGTYIQSFDFAGKAITVRSMSGDPADTILDGNGATHVVRCASMEGADTVLQDVTVTGGAASGGSGTEAGQGGGLYILMSSPTVTNCVFDQNTATTGGGVYCFDGSPVFMGCRMTGNSCSTWGGGAYVESSMPTFIDCELSDNTASLFGGGIANWEGELTLERCLLEGNSRNGLYAIDAVSTVRDCRFVGNTITSGGSQSLRNGAGVWHQSGSCTIVNCVFDGNIASNQGGGFYSSDDVSAITNCTFSRNHALAGGGIYVNVNTTATIDNCIVWGNTDQAVPSQIEGIGTITVNFSDVEGGWTGAGSNNIDANPHLSSIDLRPGACSPTIDAGDNGLVPGGVSTDIDGNPRFVDDANVADTGSGTAPIVDMGASERQVDSLVGAMVTVPGDYPTIQAAVDAICGGTITVDPGIYDETVDLSDRPITLRSAGGPAVTKITRAPGMIGVQMTDAGPQTILEGFTIEGGSWGVVVTGGAPIITRCRITLCATGLEARSTAATIRNCELNANVSNGIWARPLNGGPSPDVTVINCTIVNSLRAIRVDVPNAVTVANSILFNNSLEQIAGTTTVSYSLVEGGYAGVGNIDANPRFVSLHDDVRLGDCSPAIDAGDNGAVAGATDLDGNPRLVDDTGAADTGAGTAPIVDIGAYERQEISPPSGLVLNVPGEHTTIQAAIDAMCGGEIVVAPGTYVESIDFQGKPITLRSSGGPDVTIIDGDGATHVVLCARSEGADTILEGFTITGGHAQDNDADFGDDGGGMLIAGSPVVRQCSFEANHAGFGGGAYVIEGEPSFEQCRFVENSASYGGGAYARNTIFDACHFAGNDAQNSGGGVFASSAIEVINSVFTGNTASHGGGLFGDATIVNCTFVANAASNEGGGYRESTIFLPVTNCIFWGNTSDAGAPEQAQIGYSVGGENVTYCLVQDLSTLTGGGNFDGTPVFVDADGADDVPGTADDDCRLLASAAVEAGT